MRSSSIRVTGTRPIAADSCCARWDGWRRRCPISICVDRVAAEPALWCWNCAALVLRGLETVRGSAGRQQRAYELDPGNADTCNNIGASLQLLGRDEEALPWFDRALALRPGYVVAALDNKAASLAATAPVRRGRRDLSSGRRRIDPGNAETDWNLSLLQYADRQFRGRLGHARGALEQGRSGRLSRNSPKPIWLGEDRHRRARPS